ncbi:MAG TPA: sulfatase [Lentisphaeria bacterium]|nr:MAG: sulfatase [Lentisphaerae bacterium GWF2_49_21]HBC89718.1 sulfatase [Lentisphaeria bacterium]
MKRPNIIFILIDDMGWKDLSCYGSTFYETPNLDRLFKSGIHFTDAYASCPVCSPTRASILTGKYPATVGITDWIDTTGYHPLRGKLVDVPYLKQLPLSEYSIANALRDNGYATWHVGKWHLGGENFCPEKHGFEINVGGCEASSPGKGGYFSPWSIPALKNADVPAGTCLTGYLTDKAIELIRNRDGRSFFLNLWHYAVHTPIQAEEECANKYLLKAEKMGLTKIKIFEEGEYFHTEDKKGKRIMRRLVQSNHTYAAMIENLDENIGRLLRAVDEAGETDNTVIFFTSDNGGLATAETSPTCNSPLAEGKGWMYEGGTREPLIISWPGKIKAGSKCTEPVTSTDFYPTILEMAGIKLIPEQHSDGVSIMPYLTGEGEVEREAIYWHYPHYGNQGGTPGSSIRMGDYKLIEFFEAGRLELYNLRDDIGEERNLAGEKPELARILHDKLECWRKKVEAKTPMPNPDPNFKPWCCQ